MLDRFWPSNLFLSGIPGAWYDPTDLSTMFQDSAGTTPVTAVEQPVGLILDKSQGLANGPELSPNVGPYTNTTNWTGINSAVLSASGGELVITSGNTFSGAYITASVVAGTWLDVTIVARRGTATAAYVSILDQTNTVIVDGFANPNLTIGATNTTIRTRFLVPTGMTQARLLVIHNNQANNRTLFCSSASAKTLAGNHASQSNAASRPTYRARYNLLTYSEEFENAAWPKADVTVTANAGTAPDGTTTADKLIASATNANHLLNRTTAFSTITGTSYTVSMYAKAVEYAFVRLQLQATTFPNNWANFNLSTGAVGDTSGGGAASIASVGNGWYRCTWTLTATGTGNSGVQPFVLDSDRTGTSPSYLGNGTSGILIWGAQLLTAADVAATGNAYQRIAAATVYDTAAVFRPYLAFDGLDDSLSTSAINFTSTDKMTVFAGETKLQDATAACFCELSANVNTNAGSFTMFSPGNATGTLPGKYLVGLNASTTLFADLSSYPAPDTSVLTVSFNNAGAAAAAQLIPRVDAATPTIAYNAANAGSGNFGNHALFIGRRNNTSFPLNGRIYSLIVRGAASSVTEIADTELWVNARTGAY